MGITHESPNGPTFSGTAAAVGTINVRPYERLVLDVDLSATTETINITASVDGVNYNAAKLRPIDMATGAVTASSDIKDGLYAFDVRGLALVKITKSSTSETVTIKSQLDI